MVRVGLAGIGRWGEDGLRGDRTGRSGCGEDRTGGAGRTGRCWYGEVRIGRYGKVRWGTDGQGGKVRSRWDRIG